MSLFKATFLWFLLIVVAAADDSYIDIRRYDAVPDGATLATTAIQKAVDQCAASGGGTVYCPPGKWLSGTIFLKSHVTLYLEAGCTLLGSSDIKDYPEQAVKTRSYTDTYVRQSLIAGEDLENVAVRGRGTIDGQGGKFPGKEYLNRPFVIRLVGCRDVLVEDIHLRNSPMWMQHYLDCQRLTVRGITVFSHVRQNNDGLDIDGCRDVLVSDCMIDSGDDAVCLKSSLARSCENVSIANCRLSSNCNALKMGTESNGGFKNITVTNCTICTPRQSAAAPSVPRGMAGIALEVVDGGVLDRVTISNITIYGVNSPLFLRLGNRARPYTEGDPKPGVGTFRNVVLSNIVATHASKIGCAIAGIPGHAIENITLRDVRLEFDGGGTTNDAARKPTEEEAAYPEYSMFGALPAYGLFCRHVKNLRLYNVQLVTEQPDARPKMTFDDADEVLIDGRPASGGP